MCLFLKSFFFFLFYIFLTVVNIGKYFFPPLSSEDLILQLFLFPFVRLGLIFLLLFFFTVQGRCRHKEQFNVLCL